MSGIYSIEPCPVEQRAAALRLLHESLPEHQQTTLVQTLNTLGAGQESALRGLLIAEGAQGVVGVVWIQLTPGRTAVVWPPAMESPAATLLMQAAGKFLDDNQTVLAQLLCGPDDPLDDSLLAEGGFQELAKLSYLMADKSYFPSAEPDSELQFESHASNQPDRLGTLLLNTYEETLDCPALNGIRQAKDIVEGYQAQGNFSAERWSFVRYEDQDIGVLLLTEHAAGENWELVYMGIVPESRGGGFGWQVVQHALWQAGQGGAERVVLAVDEANERALPTYRRAGFVSWDRRTVFARIRTDSPY